MTILKHVTDIIAHKAPADFDLHHLTLCVCVSSLSDHRWFRRTILPGMMGVGPTEPLKSLKLPLLFIYFFLGGARGRPRLLKVVKTVARGMNPGSSAKGASLI